MTHAKFHFNWLMLTLIFGIWASEPPWAWRTTEKAGPDRVKTLATRYNLPNSKVSNQFKSYHGFLIYPPLWIRHLVAMHDDIENRSVMYLNNYLNLTFTKEISNRLVSENQAQ